MNPWTIGTVLVFGALSCRPTEVEHGQTRTRSGELTGEAEVARRPRAGEARDGGVAGELDRSGAPRAAADAQAPRRDEPAAYDQRFDAPRLSIVGSAKERDSNLGLVREPAIGPVDVTLPAPQQGAGAVEPSPPPTTREGAGRPGAGGDPYQ